MSGYCEVCGETVCVCDGCNQLVKSLRAAHPNTIAQWDAANEIERLKEELELAWKKERELEDLEKRQFKVIMYLHDTLEKIASVTICNVSKNIALKASETADEMLLPE